MSEREPVHHLLSEDDPGRRRPGLQYLPEQQAPPAMVASDHPVEAVPGRCQICQQMAIVEQYWPSTLPARYAELCAHCKKLGDLEIARRLPFQWRNGAAL